MNEIEPRIRECYQELEGNRAIGIDNVTKSMYGENLAVNLAGLYARLQCNAYKSKPSRVVEIPKEDGSTRPLAITCFEDKIVQLAVSQILTKIYEPLFLPCSFGYREGMNAHDALRSLMKYSNEFAKGTTVEIDLKQYFSFQNEHDASRFYQVLPKRLEKFGLKLHVNKSSVIKSGSYHAKVAASKGERLKTYKFVGFTCYWGKGRLGKWRLKFKSRSDRLAKKLVGMRQYVKQNLGVKTHIVIKNVVRIVVGWANYHAVSDNQKQVNMFIQWSTRILFAFVNRKGGKRKMN